MRATAQGHNRGHGRPSANVARQLKHGIRKGVGGKHTTPARATILSACAVAVIVLLVGFSAVHNGFVQLDDRLYASGKPASAGLSTEGLRFAFTSVAVYWHPLTWLSHELDADLFGSEPAGHHLTSVLLHAFSAGLLCLLLTRLGARSLYAAAGALLWALHPLRVESFAWVAERKDVLCALFFVACVAEYLRYQKQPSRVRYAMWLFWGGCALMSKPAAISLPLVLLLLDL